MSDVRDWLIAADDRTGAFEVAAALAPVVGPVTVTVGHPSAESGVVDIGTRGLGAEQAAERARAIDEWPVRWIAHKIDSTLRGNWAVELLARHHATGRRVLMLPGWPEMGRICVAGVVFVNGKAIGSAVEQLPGAELIQDEAELSSWLCGQPSTGGSAIAVCDVPHTGFLMRAASLISDVDLLIAGPAGALGAAFAARHLGRRAHTNRSGGDMTVNDPILVVCGSAERIAREQIGRLSAERPDIVVLSTPPIDPVAPRRLVAEAATRLTRHAHEASARLKPSTIVIVGGDTAAAYLGDNPRIVGGFAAPGMPSSRDAAGGGPLVITKAGQFGNADALIDLLGGETL